MYEAIENDTTESGQATTTSTQNTDPKPKFKVSREVDYGKVVAYIFTL